MGKKKQGILVRVISRYSRHRGYMAQWLQDEDWTDKAGNRWHILQFGNGFKCGFPRDEFEIVDEPEEL